MKNFLNRLGMTVLTAAMLTLPITGCGGSSDTGAAGSTSAAGNASSAAAGSETDNDEIVKLRVWGFGYTATSDDCAAVAEAINEITRDEIGVEIELVRSGDGEKLNLALTSGEQLDLVNYHTYSGGLVTLVNNGMATPLEELVEQYGQDAVSAVGEENLAMGKVNGTLYSIPNVTCFANSYGMAVRQDILEELDVDPKTVKTWEEMHDLLVRVKEAHPDMYPVVNSWAGGGMQKTFAFDNLGTGFWDALGILENVHDGSTKVVNMYETDSYREFCEMMYQWKQDGLLMPDVTTSNENNLCSSVGFAAFENNGPLKSQQLSKDWGKEGVVIELVSPFITSDAGGSSFFIPSVSKHPEKAMQLWNLMYKNKEIANLLTNGIEGVHYEYTDESRSSVRSLEGSTWDSMDWPWPNSSLAAVYEGTDPDIWAQNIEFSNSASVSPALGFRFDNSSVLNEITACNNVIAKYDVGLRWGELDPEEALPKFNEELKAAGLDTIIAEKQAQLDAFLAQ
ncbi:ABC transporter substrate-binding protein [Eisenbergiella porci]|uniref:ABC transporter substrate-binding protein n=1 Tax=Eisenbergiella porci TaxID=2652274 RepID=UPI002A83D321|nr:ABC transporter substrate-binding protein [Eisenbergiella porci]